MKLEGMTNWRTSDLFGEEAKRVFIDLWVCKTFGKRRLIYNIVEAIKLQDIQFVRT